MTIENMLDVDSEEDLCEEEFDILATKEEMVRAAVVRMRRLQLPAEVVDDFWMFGKLWVSENVLYPSGMVLPVLYTVRGYSFEKDVEHTLSLLKDHEILPYHVIRNNTNIGVMYSVLYVSQHMNEWAMEDEDLNEKTPFAAVYNKSLDCLDIGAIGVRPLWGGILRTA